MLGKNANALFDNAGNLRGAPREIMVRLRRQIDPAEAVLADGAPVEVYRPYAVLQMADTRAGYTVGRGQMYAVSFQAEEL